MQFFSILYFCIYEIIYSNHHKEHSRLGFTIFYNLLVFFPGLFWAILLALWPKTVATHQFSFSGPWPRRASLQLLFTPRRRVPPLQLQLQLQLQTLNS